MFSSAVQPPLISLFSSTEATLSPSFIAHRQVTVGRLLHMSSERLNIPSTPPPPANLISLGEEHEADRPDYQLDQTVLHIQSPTLRTTYMRCPPLGRLGLEHPWIHLQVRNLDREWSFEVGVVDQSGERASCGARRFRLKEPRLKLGKRPLLHLPLAFPTSSSRPLTSWSTITLNLPSLLPHFSSALLVHRRSGDADEDLDEDDAFPPDDVPREPDAAGRAAVPSGTYSHVSYVKVHATCRLRRIWFTENGPRQKLPWEFELYAAN
ncbi:uncharacterized protein B0H18DRAFT_1082924 [Fomitopsis serialis]|uniref:uncharacterized protein n=1 Tax=Fomitopsis serialis TaxID=139415 RepID=UPI002008E37F|nr:uncharacterized protein B0H18DRAFT_1082924 [Neoantrodia serialis]KAH9933796.1 hypothetical protein B0H18DRAFT_1082924 [Neoantrodia serialis]